MANILLPLVYTFMAVGRTIDLNYYEFSPHVSKSIFDPQAIVQAGPQQMMNISYYVLPDENMPLDMLGAPVDLVLRAKRSAHYKALLDTSYPATFKSFDSATILVVAEAAMMETAVMEPMMPIENFTEVSRVPPTATHYIDRIVNGGRCVSIITVRSNVTGDVQIFRKILREVMGTSGTLDIAQHSPDHFSELWKKALKAMKESKEVRGGPMVSHIVYPKNVGLPPESYENVEKFLLHVTALPMLIDHHQFDPMMRQPPDPLYVSLKPLNDFDKRYPSLKKNAETEKYLKKLNEMENDLDYAYDSAVLLYNPHQHHPEREEKDKKIDAFIKKVHDVRTAVRNLTLSDLSIYKDINVAAFKKVIETYQKGLKNSTDSYFMAFKVLKEAVDMYCMQELRPVSGLLNVEPDEVVSKGKVSSVEECLHSRFSDPESMAKYKAVAYDDDGQCLLYSRSTSSARIIPPVNGSKVYDFLCHS